MKSYHLLGIQSYANHDSGACILKCDSKGKNLDYVAISEERLIRKKYPYTFPLHSIIYCMDYFGLKHLQDIDYIFSDWIRKKQWIRSAPSYNYQEFDYIKENLNFNKKKIIQISHHLAHAASTYYPSGFESSAILVVDGNGSDLETNSYFLGKKNKIKFIKNYKSHGIGALYGAVSSKILNFGTGGEGKTMGLAPYGSSNKNTKISYSLNGIETDFSSIMRKMPYSDVLNQVSDKFRPNILKFAHKKLVKKKISNYFKDWAYRVQDISEKVLVHLGGDIKKITKNNNICLAGGVALNSVANFKLFIKNKFKKIFVFPACSDSGIPFGLAIWGYYNFIKGKKKKIVFDNAYTGRKYGIKEVTNLLTKFRINHKKVNNKYIAELLANQKIIGILRGGSEYGPRALGNRSILADPSNPKMRDFINKKVKHREVFRPFAPAILERFSKRYFNINFSPFMLLVSKSKKKNIPSAIHVDNTARVQTVSKKQNIQFSLLLEEFYKIKKIPVLLNTSFNDKNEPLVETPLDALICFFKTDLDYLIIEDILIDKNQKKNISKLIQSLESLRNKEIKNNKNRALKILTKKYDKKELSKKIIHENKKAIYHVIFRIYYYYKNFFKNNNDFYIIGSKDHTKELIDIFKNELKNKRYSILFIKKNDREIYNKNFKHEKMIKYIFGDKNKILVSSFEYSESIEKDFEKYGEIFNPYDNSSRSIMDYKFILKELKKTKYSNIIYKNNI